jgi:hypothetical protein
MEFLQIIDGDKLEPNPAYHQKGDNLYHRNCPEPCQLFSMSLSPIKMAIDNTDRQENSTTNFTNVCKAPELVSGVNL